MYVSKQSSAAAEGQLPIQASKKSFRVQISNNTVRTLKICFPEETYTTPVETFLGYRGVWGGVQDFEHPCHSRNLNLASYFPLITFTLTPTPLVFPLKLLELGNFMWIGSYFVTKVLSLM